MRWINYQYWISLCRLNKALCRIQSYIGYRQSVQMNHLFDAYNMHIEFVAGENKVTWDRSDKITI